MSEHKPIIGLTSYGTIENPDYRVPVEYVHGVVRAGGVPLVLPSVSDQFVDRWLEHLDGLVLIGGGDLDPVHYHGPGHETIYNVDAARDSAELALTRRVLTCRLPTLAICRGLQLINTVLGGTLHVHIPDVYGDRVKHRAPPRVPIAHDLSVDPRSRLAAQLGCTQLSASSWHHQAIDRLGEGLSAVAWAEDGVIEAVELADNPQLIAVQWHPELTAANDPSQQALFDSLIVLARKPYGMGATGGVRRVSGARRTRNCD